MTEVVIVYEPETDVAVINPAPVEVVADDVGLQGEPGPQGPPGAAGGESHVHTQSSPSTLWTVSPPWADRLPVSIMVYIDNVESTDSVIVTVIDDGPAFTVDVGSIPRSGKVTVS